MFNNLMDRQKTEDDLSTSALNREIAQTQENRAATKFGPQSEAERKLYTLKHPELNDFQDLSGDQAEAYDKTREAEQLRRDEMASRSHDRELQYATLANNKKTAADDKQTSKDDTDFKDIWLTAQGLKRGSS